MFFALRAVAAALLLTALPVMAEQLGPELPKPDPKGHWRVITQDDAATTSKCIGTLSTPLCAMETYMASIVRHSSADYNLSALLLPGEGGSGYLDKPLSRNSPPKETSMKYRILSASILKPTDIPPPFLPCPVSPDSLCHYLVSAWQPGDVRIIVTAYKYWSHSHRKVNRAFDGAVLRNVGGAWKVVLLRPGVNRLDDVHGKPWRRD